MKVRWSRIVLPGLAALMLRGCMQSLAAVIDFHLTPSHLRHARAYVRYRGYFRRQMLAASISHFDPGSWQGRLLPAAPRADPYERVPRIRLLP
jgi:hypothetical protein